MNFGLTVWFKIIVLSIVFLLYGCDYYDDRLQVKNMTNQDIVIETYPGNAPDTALTNKTEYYLNNAIPPNDTKRFVQMGSTKGWLFRIRKSPNNKLNIFVFKVDSLKKYGINALIEKGTYSKYMLSEAELEDKNWEVVVSN